MVTSTFGIITCAMMILLSLVLIPYLLINVVCYWLLQICYRISFSKRSLLYLELITVPLLLFVFIIYVRYAYSLEGCLILLFMTYIMTHTLFLCAYYPQKKLKLIVQLVGISLVMTIILMTIYIAFIFNPLCSLIG